jgi:hypothetical protein
MHPDKGGDPEKVDLFSLLITRLVSQFSSKKSRMPTKSSLTLRSAQSMMSKARKVWKEEVVAEPLTFLICLAAVAESNKAKGKVKT